MAVASRKYGKIISISRNMLGDYIMVREQLRTYSDIANKTDGYIVLRHPKKSSKKRIRIHRSVCSSLQSYRTRASIDGMGEKNLDPKNEYYWYDKRHDPQLRIGPSMPIILQMCAPKHATFV